jgi:hypothetical protein
MAARFVKTWRSFRTPACHADEAHVHEQLFSLRWLVGDSVASVGHDTDSETWFVRFASGSSVHVPGLWRILRDETLASTSQDHGHRFGLPAPFDALAALGQLEGKVVRTVAVRKDTGDLRLAFDGPLELEVINTSGGYEGWSAQHPELGSVFTTGCGELNSMG